MTSRHPRELVAERNLEAILDAGERLLQRGEPLTVSAVAGEAGVSRPTFYAHFPDREQLLAALVERAVQASTEVIRAAEPERGPPREALVRLVSASWEQLARHEAIARASIGHLAPEAMRHAHESARSVVAALAERGQADGSFRRDLPVAWLVTAFLALIHAAAEEVHRGELDTDAALDALRLTIADVFGGAAG